VNIYTVDIVKWTNPWSR